MGAQRLELGAEHEIAPRPAPIQRLFPHPVPRKAEALLRPVPEGQCEHAMGTGQRIVQSPVRNRGQQSFRVGLPAPLRRCVLCQQSITQIKVVINLAVINQHKAPTGRVHGLRAS